MSPFLSSFFFLFLLLSIGREKGETAQGALRKAPLNFKMAQERHRNVTDFCGACRDELV
jgi:hypothetical protein